MIFKFLFYYFFEFYVNLKPTEFYNTCFLLIFYSLIIKSLFFVHRTTIYLIELNTFSKILVYLNFQKLNLSFHWW